MMDPFVTSLPHVPRVRRGELLLKKLRQLGESGDHTGVVEILDGVSRLGRNWERWLHTVLSRFVEEQPQDPLAVIVTSTVNATIAPASLVLHERDSGGTLANLEGVLSRLELIPRVPKRILDVTFDTPHAYVYGLCAIAAWAAAHAKDIRIGSSHPRVEHFLQRAGMLEAFRNPDSEPVKFDTATILGFTRIDSNKRFDTDTHAGRLVRLFSNHLDLGRAALEALSISFAELIENSVKHGEISSPAWLFANFHPQHKIMHVCICDRGLGVRETFRRSSNPRLRELAKDPTGWIREATQPLVTSKSEGHAGYGLYLARELCRRNGGRFAILSGNAAFALHPSAPGMDISDHEEVRSLSTPWQGTLVALQFRIDRPLELGPIYDTLPLPDVDDEPMEEVSLFDD